MITASFSCFKGLSNSAEQKMWELGCLSWDRIRFLPAGTFSEKKTRQIESEINTAQNALKAELADYFLNRFIKADKIRVLNEFQAQTAVIDIETTGLSSKDSITTIAVLRNSRIHVFVKGIDLENFLMLLKGIKLLITFNGNRFDMPFLKRTFSIDLNIPHLDLMPVLRYLGYKGGQKRCECIAGMQRTHSFGIFGEDAVFLWKRWETMRDTNALKKLVIYNAEDVFMLEKLSVKAYNLAMKSYPIKNFLQPTITNKILTLNVVKSNVL